MHRPLSESIVQRLAVHTVSGALTLPPGHRLTCWHKGGLTYGSDFTRYAWDEDGLEGLHVSWFPVGRVHWVRAESCWRWQAFYPGGARSGLSKTESDPEMVPVLALGRVDAYLELYGLWPKEMRGTKTTKYAPEPCLLPMHTGEVIVHPKGYVLSEWSRLLIHLGGSTVDRYVRVWLHSDETRRQLPPSSRTGELAQRAFPGTPHVVTLIQPARGKFWTWDFRNVCSGKHRNKDTAAHKAVGALIRWGATKRERHVTMSKEVPCA